MLAFLVVLAISAGAAWGTAPPLIGEVRASEVAATSARLSGEVIPNGSPTSYSFDYIAEPVYEANLAAGGDGFAGAGKAPSGGNEAAGSSPVVVSQQVFSLSPGTSYRYRLRVESAGGVAVSLPLGFATPPPPPISCEGDACQPLPSEPAEQVVTTLIAGPGNPAAHYVKLRHRKRVKGRAHHRRNHGPHHRKARGGR